MCEGLRVGKKNGPLEEVQLQVSEGERGVRWGWWSKPEPGSKGRVAKVRNLKCFLKADSTAQVSPPLIPPRAVEDHSPSQCPRKLPIRSLYPHPKCKHTQK